MKNTLPLLAAAAIIVSACGGGDDPLPLTQLSAAQGGALSSCTTLPTAFSHANTVVSGATVIAAGTLTVGGIPIEEHCRVLGKMHERVSAVDGQSYAIGFEMRLPKVWNGRFFHQGNGGTDGVVSSAVGAVSGGGPVTNALQQGFAVVSSDAGHGPTQNPLFGLDPQARLDYGYQAVAKVTPMAKAMIAAAYGKGPERSYFGGTSNGGRHSMIAAARMPADFDGFLAVAPGFNLPKATVAQLYVAQQFAKVATTTTNLESALPLNERELIARAILARCDGLDGLVDGLVDDAESCRSAFDLSRDVPTCTGPRDGTCLTAAQKIAVANSYAGARNTKGEALYSRSPFDPGLTSANWADVKFRNSVGNTRDAVALAFIFMSPPSSTSILSDTLKFALEFSMDTDAPRIFATTTTYPESGMSFMTPPNPTKLGVLRGRGAKMIVVHGSADAAFSVDDTAAWYDAVMTEFSDARDFVRFFRVPGMAHSRAGPSTDQFDALTALVNWVEKGQAPERIVATARGPGNPGGVNIEVPADWSATRSRPLCPYPLVARYKSGDKEQASSFSCER